MTAALNASDAMQIDDESMAFQSLPSELRLCCYEFLDAGSLARLELCARESFGSTDEKNVRGSNWSLEARAAPSLIVRTSN